VTAGQGGAEVAPVILRQIGVSAEGAPLYAYADRSPVVPAESRPVRPYGAYIGVGVLGIAGVTALAFVAAILAVALSVSVVSLTICTLVLRGMWRDMQKGQSK
jgi:hypothetical protein